MSGSPNENYAGLAAMVSLSQLKIVNFWIGIVLAIYAHPLRKGNLKIQPDEAEK
jgi:hypothetical protein